MTVVDESDHGPPRLARWTPFQKSARRDPLAVAASAAAMVSESAIATVVLVAVSLSFPCFVYGAYYIIETEPVTWDVLLHHLSS